MQEVINIMEEYLNKPVDSDYRNLIYQTNIQLRNETFDLGNGILIGSDTRFLNKHFNFELIFFDCNTVQLCNTLSIQL